MTGPRDERPSPGTQDTPSNFDRDRTIDPSGISRGSETIGSNPSPPNHPETATSSAAGASRQTQPDAEKARRATADAAAAKTDSIAASKAAEDLAKATAAFDKVKQDAADAAVKAEVVAVDRLRSDARPLVKTAPPQTGATLIVFLVSAVDRKPIQALKLTPVERSFRIGYNGQTWEHCADNAAGEWLYSQVV